VFTPLPFLRTPGTMSRVSYGEQSHQGPGLPDPASHPGPAILDDCRAARIADVTDFAECLVNTRPSCPNRLTFSTFRYCVHPQREAIIARTLATESPLGS
jgi:hypothetical protein